MTKPTADEEARVRELKWPWDEFPEDTSTWEECKKEFHAAKEWHDQVGVVAKQIAFERGGVACHPKAIGDFLLQLWKDFSALTQSRQRAIEVVKTKRDEWQSHADSINPGVMGFMDDKDEESRYWNELTKVSAANELLRELEG